MDDRPKRCKTPAFTHTSVSMWTAATTCRHVTTHLVRSVMAEATSSSGILGESVSRVSLHSKQSLQQLLCNRSARVYFGFPGRFLRDFN